MTDKIAQLQSEIAQLKRESELKTGWISLISHNLKENFGSLLWIIEALENKSISKEVFLEMLPQIKQDTQKNFQTVNDTGDWIRTQINGFAPQLAPELAFDLFKKLKKNQKIGLKNKNLRFQFFGDQDLSYVTDQFLIFFILNKIVENAIKYSHPGKEIHFLVEKQGESVRFSILDFGIGMDSTRLETLLSFPSAVYKGTNGEVGAGLSLKIVNNFVSLLKGKLEFLSELNQGTTTSVIIPNI